jgi:hypothetical protein
VSKHVELFLKDDFDEVLIVRYKNSPIILKNSKGININYTSVNIGDF